ncbi:hypothetical protein V2J09_008639 [Rumex salicifolius]
MAKTFSMFNLSFLFHLPKRNPSFPKSFSFLLLSPNPKRPAASQNPAFSTTATPFPLQYELIAHRPAQNLNHPSAKHNRLRLPHSKPTDYSDSEPDASPSPELSFEDWVDKKLAKNDAKRSIGRGKENNNSPESDSETMDKAKTKYYNKRRKRMYGSDSEDERRAGSGDGFVELKPEFVELRTLHKREEELYFYDTFAYPWEKDKHYKMVYQLEKKYFPDQCFDKAFLQPGEEKHQMNKGRPKKANWKIHALKGENVDVTNGVEEDKGLIFFDEKHSDDGTGKDKTDLGKNVSEKKVEEFFKTLKKVPTGKNGDVSSSACPEPFLASRSNGLPSTWDTPIGTVVLINKPKGWTSFTVCGKLRRLVNVKKVGHAGTLDPMATGLLIVCVGKSTKLVDRYQGMVKGYTGVFRLGEATSTWDADSPVIQREPWEHIKTADVKKAAASFVGEIWQVPPMFSAIKVGGERMYEKARRGESIELSPRRISIFQFDIEPSLEDRQNLIFRVICSKGTYIRSLCADLGKALGSCAHLTALRRESIGEYKADDAFEFQELEEQESGINRKKQKKETKKIRLGTTNKGMNESNILLLGIKVLHSKVLIPDKDVDPTVYGDINQTQIELCLEVVSQLLEVSSLYQSA